MSSPKVVKKYCQAPPIESRLSARKKETEVGDNPVHGVINFKVIAAKNLANADLIGYSDPFCIIRSDFNEEIFEQTKTIPESLNPSWNEQYTFAVNQRNSNGNFLINIFDEDLLVDDWLGLISISLLDIVTKGVSGWLPLSLETKKPTEELPASILVEVSFQPTSPEKPFLPSILPIALQKKMFPEELLPQETRIETDQDVEKLYEFAETLGQGATGIVKSAFIKKNMAHVAIKIMDKHSKIWDEEMVKAYHIEAAILQKVNFINLLNAKAIHETESHCYIVMEVVSGGDLFEAIVNSEEGFLPLHLAKNWAYQILSAINYLHQNNICHRDIKTENVLLSSKDLVNAIVKLVDYGASAFFTEEEPFMTSHSGTLQFMAPEIIAGTKYTKIVDMWSFGVLVFVMLSGYEPFGAENEVDTTQRIMDGDLNFDSFWSDHDIPIEAQRFISSCLIVDPEARLSVEQALVHPWFQSKQLETV